MNPKLILIWLASMTLACAADVQPQPAPGPDSLAPSLPRQEQGPLQQTFLPVGVTESFISEVIPVKYALASEVLRRAEAFADIQRLGPTKIIADERSNSLLVFASGQDIEKIKGLVSKFDVVLAQVLIEAVVARVSLDDPASSRPGKASHHRTPGNDLLRQTDGLLVTQFVFGAETNAAGGLPGGLGHMARLNDDLDAMVSALTTNSRVLLLQRPRIQTSVGVPASIFVGESPSYSMGSSLTCVSAFRTLSLGGLTLEVTPSINSDGSIAMDIHQSTEKASGTVRIANVGEVPTVTRQEAQARVTVRNHGTVLLGGMVSENKNPVSSGASPHRTRSELIVLIRPTILPTPEAATQTFSR